MDENRCPGCGRFMEEINIGNESDPDNYTFHCSNKKCNRKIAVVSVRLRDSGSYFATSYPLEACEKIVIKSLEVYALDEEDALKMVKLKYKNDPCVDLLDSDFIKWGA